MKQILWQTQREIAMAVDGPALRTAAVVFALLVHGLFFFVGYPIGELRSPGLWELRSTDALSVVFAWVPLLFALAAPALCMGLWSEERRAGTEELLRAWPLRSGTLVIAKFAAALFQLALLWTIALAPLVAVAAYLGPVDIGATLVAAVGALLLGAAYLAFAQLVSACTRDPLSAFLVASLVLAAAWSPVLLVRLVPGAVAEWLVLVSPASQYLAASARGVVELSEVVLGLGVCVGALHLCALVVESRRWQ